MNTLIKQATKILSYLSEADLEKDIIELSENNTELISFLEKIGAKAIKYQNEDAHISILPHEIHGEVHLWYRRNDGVWIIKLYEIKRMINK